MRTLAEHILDIVQNSVRAKANLIEVIVEESKINNLCVLTITDNGCGMDAEMLKQAANPFFTSRKKRNVGLGISLLKQNAEAAGGRLLLESKPGEGTRLCAEFQRSNIDRSPAGDIPGVLYLLLLSCRDRELVYRHKTDIGEFKLSTHELEETLGDVSWQQKEIRNGIIDWIKNNLDEIKATR